MAHCFDLSKGCAIVFEDAHSILRKAWDLTYENRTAKWYFRYVTADGKYRDKRQ